MTDTTYVHELAAWALALLPVIFGVGALALPRLVGLDKMWRASLAVAGAGTLLSLLAGCGLVAGGGAVVGLWTLPWGEVRSLGVRLDSLSVTMATLVCVVAWVIVRYSRQYLAGDMNQGRFVRWFWATVGSVSLLVVTDHLAVLAIGWIAASLSLHQLLVFYPERTQATLAAHKKFLLSRMADVCLLTAFAFIGWYYNSFQLQTIFAALEAAGSDGSGLSAGVVMATVLIAAAMILKCAQLPFHGWLIQVMEAPTPVSALLHAGVVNIGGFLLIRLAPLMSLSPAAQWLLLVVGSVTAVVAGLVMMTRISVKVMLAWSTCAQMGFMLLECGLGAYSLALLHLVAHSLYKAYCFLGSGSAVTVCAERKMAAGTARHRVIGWAAALVGGVAFVTTVAILVGADPAEEPGLWAMAGIVSVGIATMFGETLAQRDGRMAITMLLRGGAVVLAYFAWHGLSVGHAGLPLPSVDPYPGMVGFVLVLFALQFVVYAASRIAPGRPEMTWLHAYLYHGMYLDEIFTRLTFLIWPPRLPRVKPHPTAPTAITITAEEGVRI